MTTTKKSRPRTKPAAATDEFRIIKKYTNRRLYDTRKRAYITLNDIKKYVLDEIKFRVLDAQSGHDLTKATLFQVIIEHESSENTFFTPALLQQMIKLYHDNMQNIFSKYFEQTLAQFIQHKDIWSRQFGLWQSKKEQNSTLNSSFTNPFTAMQEITQLQRQFWDTLTHKPEKK